jgi:chromosome segregation ATPase
MFLSCFVIAAVAQAYTLYAWQLVREQATNECQITISELTLQLQESHRYQFRQKQQAAKDTQEQQQALVKAQEEQERLQKEFDELYQSATELLKNRDDWEALAKHLEEDLLDPLEAQLKSLQTERDQLHEERERLSASIHALEKEKVELARRLSQAGG